MAELLADVGIDGDLRRMVRFAALATTSFLFAGDILFWNRTCLAMGRGSCAPAGSVDQQQRE